MKKTFSTIAAFCIGLLVSISIYACADDFKDPSLMGSGELESLKEIVMKYNEKVEKQSDGGSVVVTIATTSNDIATINMLIWANILNQFL